MEEFFQRFLAFNQIKKLGMIQNPVLDTHILQHRLGSDLGRFSAEQQIRQRQHLATNQSLQLECHNFFLPCERVITENLGFLLFFYSPSND